MRWRDLNMEVALHGANASMVAPAPPWPAARRTKTVPDAPWRCIGPRAARPAEVPNISQMRQPETSPVSAPHAAPELLLRVHDNPAAIDAGEWNRLLEAQASPTPFMRHEYLLALQQSGSAVPDTGWALQWLCVETAGRLQAACPVYVKGHSYGEYVFDWAWADAYQRHGLPYYPKLLCAVPFTPVPGSRLLARDACLAPPVAARAAAGRDGRRSVFCAPAVHRRSRSAGCASRGLDAASDGAIPLAQPRQWRLCRLQSSSWPACSATSARRSRRSAVACSRPASASAPTRARRSTPSFGTSSTSATR